jgi:hypothetical protein
MIEIRTGSKRDELRELAALETVALALRRDLAGRSRRPPVVEAPVVDHLLSACAHEGDE